MFMCDINLNQYDVVLCDSNEAIQWLKKSGLPDTAVIKSSSPALLFSSDNQTRHIESRWGADEMCKFQESIKTHSEDIFEILFYKGTCRRDIALSIVSSVVSFQKVLFKAACLGVEDMTKKTLFVKVKSYAGKKKLNVNPPWDDIMRNFDSLDTIEYTIDTVGWGAQDLSVKNVSFLKRVRLSGIETILYRLWSKFSKYIPSFLLNYQILVPKENELLIQTAAHLIQERMSIIPIEINSSSKKKNHESDYDFNLIQEVIKKRLNKWVIPELHDNCFSIIRNLINNDLSSLQSCRLQWSSVLGNKYLKPVVLTSVPSTISGFALTQLCREKKISTFSFQHGVTQEINKYHGEVSFLYEINTTDYYFSYNKSASKVSEESYFKYGKSYSVGLSNRHMRHPVLSSPDKSMVYISTNLYKGNIGYFCTHLTDFGRAKDEKNLICNVLGLLPHCIYYKPYPEENLRYSDQDPVFDIASKYDNIKVLFDKVDMRFFVDEYRVFITSSATSTLTWPLLTGKPVIFINWDSNSMLLDSAQELFSKGLFLFNSSDVDFEQSLLLFLSKPVNEIEDLYRKKMLDREKLIKKYFTQYKKKSGARAARIICDILL